VNSITSEHEGSWVGFLTKFKADGSGLVYSTKFGFGSGGFFYSGRFPYSVAVDAGGTAVVAGFTKSAAAQGTSGAFQASPPSDLENGFVVKIHPASIPGPPTGLAATPVSPYRVDLAWADGGDDETAYEVERSVEGGAFAALATLPADAVSYSDQGRDPLRTYAYRVRATNSVGASAFEVSGDATTPGTLDLAASKGKARDSVDEGKDSLKVKGALAFGAEAPDLDFGYAEDGLEVRFGDPGNPFVLSVPAGDPGWKVKKGRYTWKSARGTYPKVKLVLDFPRGRFSLAAKKFDFPAGPTGPVRISIRCGNDAGLEDAAWTPHATKPGLLRIDP
jgi:hypothetical protein